jgi:hypothetical protein
MGKILNKDFREFIQSFEKNKVEYILVGGFAVILHGYPRTTGDIDLWVNRTKDNYKKIEFAFLDFGMQLFDMTQDNFLHHKYWDVFTFGKSPVAIDIMVKVKGLEFETSFKNAVFFKDEDLNLRTLSKDDLIKAKLAVKRGKDLDDLENL